MIFYKIVINSNIDDKYLLSRIFVVKRFCESEFLLDYIFQMLVFDFTVTFLSVKKSTLYNYFFIN